MINKPKKNLFTQCSPDNFTAYVIVHPDDFALSLKKTAKQDTTKYKFLLKQRVRKLLNSRVSVYLLNLDLDSLDPPAFLSEFQGEKRFYIIPTLKKDSVDSQANRLKFELSKFIGLKKIIFTGGWRNACLKHTLNNTITGIQRISFIEKIDKPFKAQLHYKKSKMDVIVMCDHEFIF